MPAPALASAESGGRANWGPMIDTIVTPSHGTQCDSCSARHTFVTPRRPRDGNILVSARALNEGPSEDS